MEFNPDIILADYKLPNFDGIHAILIAKEYCPDVPIIIVSGAVGEEEAIEILKSGATDFVLKDRLSSRLVPALHRAMREVAERDARRLAEASLHSLNAQLELRISERTSELASKHTPSLPDAHPRSDRFRCGGRESEFLAVKAVKGVTNTARSLRIVSRAAQALNMTQKTWKTTGSLLTLGISAANLARPPHSPTPVPILTVSGAADAKANSLQSETQMLLFFYCL